MKPLFAIPAILSYLLFCAAMLPVIMAAVAWTKMADRLTLPLRRTPKVPRPRHMVTAFK